MRGGSGDHAGGLRRARVDSSFREQQERHRGDWTKSWISSLVLLQRHELGTKRRHGRVWHKGKKAGYEKYPLLVYLFICLHVPLFYFITNFIYLLIHSCGAYFFLPVSSCRTVASYGCAVIILTVGRKSRTKPISCFSLPGASSSPSYFYTQGCVLTERLLGRSVKGPVLPDDVRWLSITKTCWRRANRTAHTASPLVCRESRQRIQQLSVIAGRRCADLIGPVLINAKSRGRVSWIDAKKIGRSKLELTERHRGFIHWTIFFSSLSSRIWSSFHHSCLLIWCFRPSMTHGIDWALNINYSPSLISSSASGYQKLLEFTRSWSNP